MYKLCDAIFSGYLKASTASWPVFGVWSVKMAPARPDISEICSPEAKSYHQWSKVITLQSPAFFPHGEVRKLVCGKSPRRVLERPPRLIARLLSLPRCRAADALRCACVGSERSCNAIPKIYMLRAAYHPSPQALMSGRAAPAQPGEPARAARRRVRPPPTPCGS